MLIHKASYGWTVAKSDFTVFYVGVHRKKAKCINLCKRAKQSKTVEYKQQFDNRS